MHFYVKNHKNIPIYLKKINIIRGKTLTILLKYNK